MIKETIKEAFLEGREIGGEWEDSESKIVNDILPLFDLDTVVIRQRFANGKFGKTFYGLSQVKVYIQKTHGKKAWSLSNFKTTLFTGGRRELYGCRWEVVI
jgi:hypothetical protein